VQGHWQSGQVALVWPGLWQCQQQHWCLKSPWGFLTFLEEGGVKGGEGELSDVLLVRDGRDAGGEGRGINMGGPLALKTG
jgi:hypothetical protein